MKIKKDLKIDNNSINYTIMADQNKSRIDIGNNFSIYTNKHFNWFERIMWQILLGVKITNSGKEKENLYNDGKFEIKKIKENEE